MLALLRPIVWINTKLLRLGRTLAWMALALMVAVILLQVFFRYALNNALAWPDEAARFLMLWMTGLMAPSAFRWSGFVAIDMLPQALPRRLGLVLTFVLFLFSIAVLITALGHGYDHTMGFGGKFDSSSLRLPLDLIGLDPIKVKLKFMYASLFVCVAMMIAVNIELLLRNAISLMDPDAELPDDDAPHELLGAD